jgi:FkbM family methyltransferase
MNMSKLSYKTYPLLTHLNMTANWVCDNLLPPLLKRALTRGIRRRVETERFKVFYENFASAGDLCFDIGANLGNRVRSFRAMGCRVVALEPQSLCLKWLHKDFDRDALVTVVPKAAGSKAGTAVLKTSAVHTLSTLSDSFASRTCASGRFAAVEWRGEETVQITTLDVLIADYGLPKFVKIDVEGFESEVLAGLSQPIPTLSFEWTPEIPENALACLSHLTGLGNYEFNYSWGESLRLARPIWLDETTMKRVVEDFAGENQMFGDIYARLRG